MNLMVNRAFWQGKKVFLTGHTGFKGSWLMLWLQQLGADVHGMALAPDTTPSLFDQLNLNQSTGHFIGDIRDAGLVRERIQSVAPDIVLHLAAQPLVLRGYREPLETWATNVMGTAHILDALKDCDRKTAVLCITTDKVYQNREQDHAYQETDRLGGFDPYSASKAACELTIDSYRNSYFSNSPVRIASARAGNVIGGGDWAENRILPDLARAMADGDTLAVRNPYAIRPWQHVLDPLAGYLVLAEALWNGADVTEGFNFGPDASDQRPVRDLVETALSHWPGKWNDLSDPYAPHEAGRLTLSIDKARDVLNWTPVWGFDTAVRQTIEWYRAVHGGDDPLDLTLQHIRAFETGEGA